MPLNKIFDIFFACSKCIPCPLKIQTYPKVIFMLYITEEIKIYLRAIFNT